LFNLSSSLSSKASFRRFMVLIMSVALVFSLVPSIHAAKPSKPNLLEGVPASYVNSSEFVNPYGATDGDDSTSTDLGQQYSSYHFYLAEPTKVGKLRIVVDDYRKFYGPVPIRFYYTNFSYAEEKDVKPNSNDYTTSLNLDNVIAISISPAAGVNPGNPLRIFSIQLEQFEDNTSPPTVPEFTDTQTGNASVDLEWSASTDADEAIGGYNIYQNGQYLTTVDEGTTTYTATDLVNGTPYTFQVSAYDTKINESARSAPVILTPLNLTPPSIVEGVEVQPGNAKATLTWDENVEMDINGYDVYVDGVRHNISAIPNTTYVVTGLTNMTAYSFEVVAVNTSNIASGKSDTVSATPINTVAPAVPTNVEAVSGNAEVTLTWNENVEADIRGYDVYVDGDRANVSTVTGTTYLATGLTNATAYSFEVVAINTSNLQSEKSEAVSATPLNTVAPAVPTNVEAVSGNAEVTLTWDENEEADIQGYDVYVDGVRTNGSTVTGSTYQVTGLTNAIAYSFEVVAINKSNTASEKSEAVSATPLNTVAPAVPTNVAAVSGDQRVTLSWNANEEVDIKGYDVYVDGVRTNASIISGATYVVTGLTNATAYSFEVVAINTSNLQSEKSEAVSVTPLSTDATITSTIGTVSENGTENETITAIPYGITLTALKSAITPATGATYGVYLADGITEATTLATGNKIIVTAQDEVTQITYTVTVLKNTDATLASTIGTVSENGTGNETITAIPYGTTLTALKAVITPAAGATYGVYLADGITEATILATGNKIIVTAQDEVTQITYTVAVNAAAPSNGGGNNGSVPAPTPGKVTSTAGVLTIPTGTNGEVSLEDEITITIPTGAAAQELKITIAKLLDTSNVLINKEVLASSIYEVLKDLPGNFNKPVTLTFAFDASNVKSGQGVAVFYFDEVKKAWVEVKGGKTSGNHITVETNHFTKFAVFVVDLTTDLPVSEVTTPAEPEISLSDIAGHWAEASIKQAVKNGIVNGYVDGTFKPGNTVTRAEFSVMLMKAIKRQEAGAELTFTDKADIGSWAQAGVAQAVQAGIINGYEDGTFRPNANMTRAEMATMIAKALRLTIEPVTTTGFADDERIPSWAKGAVAALKNLGIIGGKDANTFDPSGKATRAEAVTVLIKLLANKSE
jgi:hypothetical protein